MSLDRIFTLANTFVLPAWLLLVFLPRWRWTPRIVNVVVPGLLGVTYLTLAILYFGEAEGGFGSIADVRSLFGVDGALVAGWIHYLAFDLLVGSWEVRDARREEIPHLWVVPCLALTFLLGPVGFVAYLGVRLALRRRLFAEEGT